MAPQRFPAAMAAAFMATATHASTIVRISSQPTSNMSCAAGVCTPAAARAVLNVDELAAMLSSGNARVETDGTADLIEVDAALSWSGTGHLVLKTAGQEGRIAVNQHITVAGAGELDLFPGPNGALQFFGKGRVEFADTSAELNIGGNHYVLFDNMAQIRKAFRNLRRAPRYAALARNVNARGKLYSRPVIARTLGDFHGLGNTISNLDIVDALDKDVGFIGQIDGMCDALHFENAHVVGAGTGQNVGVAAGASGNPATGFTGCSASGEVEAGADSNAGGLVGLNLSGVFLSHASVNVTAGAGSAAGGLVGRQIAKGLAISYATGTVSGGDGAFVGGLLGLGEAVQSSELGVEGSYATGAVLGGDAAVVGGLIGSGTGRLASRIDASYSTGSVGGGTGAVTGGLAGSTANVAFRFDYWDLDTSGIADPAQGVGNATSAAGVAGLGDAALKSALPSGFAGKFFHKKVWGQAPDINDGYPYLTFIRP